METTIVPGLTLDAEVAAAGLGGEAILLTVLWAGAGLGTTGWLVGAGFAAGLAALLNRAVLRTAARSLGPADRVTLARAVLVGGVTALVADHAGPMALVPIAAVALLLDAVDGQVARRTRTVSAMGARFDMEIDAVLILVLSVQVGRSLGVWVLAIGLMRYVFAVAGRFAPWLRAELPPSRARKTVAALQGVLLAVLAAGVLPYGAAMLVAGLALAALCWSFGRDTGWLYGMRVAASNDLRWTPAQVSPGSTSEM
jgi:phosphatidylglycerophosphate synthase